MSFGHISIIKRSGDDSGIACPITPKGVAIGRDLSCEIRVQMPRVSRLHCKVVVETDSILLQNLSKNSISVNASKLGRNQTVELHDGDIFRVIDREFRFDGPSSKENAPNTANVTTVADGTSTVLVETCPKTKQRKISIEVPVEPRRSLGKRSREPSPGQHSARKVSRSTRTSDASVAPAQPAVPMQKVSMSPLQSLESLPESPFHPFHSGFDKRASAISFIDPDSSMEVPTPLSTALEMPYDAEEPLVRPEDIKDPNIAIKAGDPVFQVGQMYKKQVGQAQIFTACTPKPARTAGRPSSILKRPQTAGRMRPARISFAPVDKVLLTPMRKAPGVESIIYTTPCKTASPLNKTEELPILMKVPDEFLNSEEEADYSSEEDEMIDGEGISPSMLCNILATRPEASAEPFLDADDEESDEEMLPAAEEAAEAVSLELPARKRNNKSLPHHNSTASSGPKRFQSWGDQADIIPTFSRRVSAADGDEDLVTDQEMDTEAMVVASARRTPQGLKALDLDPMTPSESECTPIRAQPLNRGSKSTGRANKAIPFPGAKKAAVSVTPTQAKQVRRAHSTAPTMMPTPVALPSPKRSSLRPVTEHVATPLARRTPAEAEEDMAPPAISLPAESSEDEAMEASEPVEDATPLPVIEEAPVEAAEPASEELPITGLLAKRKRSRRSSTAFAKSVPASPVESPEAKRPRASMAAAIPAAPIPAPAAQEISTTTAVDFLASPIAEVSHNVATVLSSDVQPRTPKTGRNSLVSTPVRFTQSLASMLYTPVRALSNKFFSDSASECQQKTLFALWTELRNYLREDGNAALVAAFSNDSTNVNMTVMYDRIHSGEYQAIATFEDDFMGTIEDLKMAQPELQESLGTLAAFAFDLFFQAKPQPEEEASSAVFSEENDQTIEDDLWNVLPAGSPMAPAKAHLQTLVEESRLAPEPSDNSEFFSVREASVGLCSPVPAAMPMPRAFDPLASSVDSAPATPIAPAVVEETVVDAPAAVDETVEVDAPMVETVAEESEAVVEEVVDVAMEEEPSDMEPEVSVVEEAVEEVVAALEEAPVVVEGSEAISAAAEPSEEAEELLEDVSEAPEISVADAGPSEEMMEDIEASEVVPDEANKPEEASEVADEVSMVEASEVEAELEPSVIEAIGSLEDNQASVEEDALSSLDDGISEAPASPEASESELMVELSESSCVAASPEVSEAAPAVEESSSEEELVVELSEVTEKDAAVPQVDYNSWTCVVLRKELKSRGLDTKGLKRVLVARLEDDDSAPQEPSEEEALSEEEVAEPSAEEAPVAEVAVEESSSEGELLVELSESQQEASEASEEDETETPKVDYNSWTCVVLRKELKKRGLDQKGLKRVLVQRLNESDLESSASASPEPIEVAPKAKKPRGRPAKETKVAKAAPAARATRSRRR